jgi:hypothetical protein
MRATIKRPARRCNEQQALPHEDLMASFHDAEHVISQTVQKRTKSLNLHNNGPSERFNNRDTVATVTLTTIYGFIQMEACPPLRLDSGKLNTYRRNLWAPGFQYNFGSR